MTRKDKEKVHNFFEKFGSPIYFYAGSEKLNPVPTFIIGKISENLFGGFISGLMHTWDYNIYKFIYFL